MRDMRDAAVIRLPIIDSVPSKTDAIIAESRLVRARADEARIDTYYTVHAIRCSARQTQAIMDNFGPVDAWRSPATGGSRRCTAIFT